MSMVRRLCRQAVLFVVVIAAAPAGISPLAIAARSRASAATTGSLSIGGFINHFFSYRLSACGQQTVGYDNSRDGVIDVQQEGERVDGKCRVWQAHSFLKAVNTATSKDIFISKSNMRTYLRRFDANHNGRIDAANQEFQRMYRSVFHARPPRTARYGSFERRFYGG
jgi:hypothetical protein